MGGSCQLPGGLTWTLAELRETGDLGEVEAVPDFGDPFITLREQQTAQGLSTYRELRVCHRFV